MWKRKLLKNNSFHIPGWINADLFVDFLMHISDFTGYLPDCKILVLLDNNKLHLSIAAID